MFLGRQRLVGVVFEYPFANGLHRHGACDLTGERTAHAI